MSEKTSLQSILDQYEKNKSSQGGSGFERKEVDLTKYFSEKLREGQKSDEKRVRILPNKSGSPFVEAYWHEVQVNKQYSKIYCTNKNDGTRCPLCEAHEALKMTGNSTDKELAKQFSPRLFYVVKVIDRSSEKEGVKFWRFKHYYNGEGVLDKLIPIIKKRGEIHDPRSGRDLTLSLERDTKGRSKLTSIMDEDPSLLTDPKSENAKNWIGNEETYKDVYRPKSIDYMEIVAKGMEPVWDKEQKKFVSKDDLDSKPGGDLDSEIKMMTSKKSTPTTTTTTVTKKPVLAEIEEDEEVSEFVDQNSGEEEEGELPF
jgi:hypothetical protein